MKVFLSLFILLLSLFLGYLFYAPIPEGMVDQWPYRQYVAFAKTAALITNFRSLFDSNVVIPFATVTDLFEAFVPEADKPVPGSKFTARYTEFDGVKVLLYEPVTKPKEHLPGLIYTHSGGYVRLSSKFHGAFTRRLAEELNVVLVSIDYRLAPIHPFPAGFDDCFTATSWFLKHASEYGVDTDRVAVLGDSGGGYLASVLVQHVLDDRTLPDIKAQVLLYPWMQSFDLHTPAYQQYDRQFGPTGMLPRKQIAEYISAILYSKLDEHFMHQLQQNAHTSAEFKQSTRYTYVLDHSIIPKMLKRTMPSESYASEIGAVRSYEEGNDTLWDEIKNKLLDPRLAPLFRKDFKGLPPTLMVTCDMDSVRDDGIFYVRLLEEAGVPVTWKHYPGAYHAIAALGPIKDIPTGVEMVDESIKFIRKHL